jgi:chemotaxis signal transduction protein
MLHKNISAAQKMIVLKEETDRLALLVDDIVDFAEIDTKELLMFEAEETVPSQADGLASAFFEWKNNPVCCLEIKELISQIKQGAVQLGA